MMTGVFFQAEDGIRDLVRSRGLGDVYKRQAFLFARLGEQADDQGDARAVHVGHAAEVEHDQALSLIHI